MFTFPATEEISEVSRTRRRRKTATQVITRSLAAGCWLLAAAGGCWLAADCWLQKKAVI
jgi:hypothetical protein